MSATQGGFLFAAINVVDVQGLAVAVINQLNVFSTYFETRMGDLRDPDLSQDMGDQVQHMEQAIDMRLAVSLTEMNDRITRAEMRNEQIAAVGDRVVGDMGAWTDGALVTFLKQRAELEQIGSDLKHVVQQTQVKFQTVEDAQQQLHTRDLEAQQLRTRDLEAFRSDLHSYISQVRSQDATSIQADFQSYQSQAMHHFQTLEAQMDALALSAASTARDDPWHQARVGAAPRYPSENGAAQTGIPGADDPLRRWYTDGGAQRPAPAIPPGIPRSWETRSEFRPDLRNRKEAQLDLSVRPEISKLGKCVQCAC